MFFWGVILGTILVVALYEIIGRHRDTESSVGFFFSRPFISAAILGIVFLIAAVGLEAYINYGTEYWSVFLSLKTYISVLKEFFFAFLIAMFIIATVELSSRKEQEKIFAEATDEAQKAVFDAVYKRVVEPSVFDEVEHCIFMQNFVRTRHSRDIILKRLEGEENFILLDSSQTYRIKNTNKEGKLYRPPVYIPRAPFARLSAHNVVKQIALYQVVDGVRGKPIYELTDAAKIEEKLKPDANSPEEKFYEFKGHTILPGVEVEVVISLQLVKEKYDNELWTSLIPTLEAEVMVNSELDDLRLGAISLHRGAMTPIGAVDENAKIRRWRIEKPLLSYQGYLVSWSAQDTAQNDQQKVVAEVAE